MEAILVGTATRQQLDRAHEHAASCGVCRGVLAGVAGLCAPAPSKFDANEVTVPDDDRESRDVPLKGTRLGRFVIERELGRGGMGVVFAAHDEFLHRSVALKVLYGHYGGPVGRLLREARAMARVEHPNVVAVHDASVEQDQVYLVMDLVDGPHLGRWLQSRLHSWQEVVAIFVEAGRGLAAIHDAGLIHRDFKPQNVLVGSDGRARVTDFGLVRANVDVEGPTPGASMTGSGRTLTGSVVGTPQFMAPEQLGGGEITAAADQFSFCASLYEALTGVPPFGRGGNRERLQRMAARRVERPSDLDDVPNALLLVVERGLSFEPETRFPSMHGLVSELSGVLTRRRQRKRGVIIAALTVAAVGAGIYVGEQVQERPCSSQGDEIDAVWGAQRRQEAVRGLGAASDDAEAVDRLLGAIDHHAEAWAEASRQACEQDRRDDAPSASARAAVLSCLGRRRVGLDATVTTILQTPELGPRPALRVVRELAAPDACLDEARREDAPTNSATPEQLAESEALAAKILVWAEAGSWQKARDSVEEMSRLATSVDDARVHASRYSQEARLLRISGEPEQALQAWYQAYPHAARAGGEVLERTLVQGVDHHVVLSRLEAAELLLELAEQQRQARGDTSFSTAISTQRGLIESQRGNLAEAEEHLRAVVEATRGRPARASTLSVVCGNMGVLAHAQGRLAEAQQWFDEAVEAASEVWDPAEPSLLELRRNRAVVYMQGGEFDRARSELEVVAELARTHDRPRIEADVLTALGSAERALDDPEAALATDRRSVAVHLATYGESDPRTAEARLGLGRDLFEQQRLDDAERVLRTSLEHRVWSSSPERITGPTVRGLLAQTLAARGSEEEAIALVEATLQRIDEDRSFNPLDLRLMEFFHSGALVYEGAGRYQPMLELALRMQRIVEANETSEQNRRTTARLVRRAQEAQ